MQWIKNLIRRIMAIYSREDDPVIQAITEMKQDIRELTNRQLVSSGDAQLREFSIVLDPVDSNKGEVHLVTFTADLEEYPHVEFVAPNSVATPMYSFETSSDPRKVSCYIRLLAPGGTLGNFVGRFYTIKAIANVAGSMSSELVWSTTTA